MNKIVKPCYAMALVNNDSAEITMYGEIVESQPTDWWTGEPLEGQYIIESEFLSDLEEISNCRNITIRMNSCGGDAGVSILIHNRLRELAAQGKNLTCIVDGVAMSGGSLIMCACDNVKVNASSLIMIHKAWSYTFGRYNADELRSAAKRNDAWDKAQVSIYSRKCKLDDTAISSMMADTTYMTGKEALEKGFADELIEDDTPSVSANSDRTALYVHGRKIMLAKGMLAPPTIPITASEEEVINNKPDYTGRNGGNIMAKNLEELRQENPELASVVENEIRATVSAENADAVTQAVNAERQRLSEIDDMAHLFDVEMVRDAKYGEQPCTAKDMTYNAALKAKQAGSAFMTGVMKDFKGSGAEGVGAAPHDGDEGPKTESQKKAEAKANVAKLLGKDE